MDLRSTKAFKFWERYEHHLGVGALIVGFLFDLEVAKRPDSTFNNILLLSYLAAAGAFIIILNLRETRRKEGHSYEPFFLLLALQFCFGGLASNLLVLYGHSGTFAGSVLFLGLLVALVFGNEYFRNRYTLLRFNVGMYYILLLSYCLIAVPTFLFHSLSTAVFLVSGILSLVCIAIFLGVLFITVFRGRDVPHLRGVVLIVGAIFISFNILYFLNVIPPVPLSMKSIGIYHSILPRSGGDYIALYEKPEWWRFWRDTATIYTPGVGQSAFCFSSVFAPTDLKTPIFHRWEKYNTETKQWDSVSHVSFPINGGREEGYRGWSVKSKLTPGDWRCNVETESGALIGRVGFTVLLSSTTPTLSQTML